MLRHAAPLLALLGALAMAGCSRTGLLPLDVKADAGPEPGARCDDGVFCNGKELCEPGGSGCLPGKAELCDDADECTLDRCDQQQDRCVQERTPRDRDRDGFDACGGDCDD